MHLRRTRFSVFLLICLLKVAPSGMMMMASSSELVKFSKTNNVLIIFTAFYFLALILVLFNLQEIYGLLVLT